MKNYINQFTSFSLLSLTLIVFNCHAQKTGTANNAAAITTTVLSSVTIHSLRCEYLKNPLGIDKKNPRLFWKMESPEKGQYQSACQILVSGSKANLDANNGDLWNSGKIISDQSIQVYYAGKPLLSEMQCYWKVKIWDKDGKESSWSETGFWSMGLLQKSDWTGKWIGLEKTMGPDDTTNQKMHLAARVLRNEFNLPKKVKKATAYISGLGQSELYINGEKISDHVLSPALSGYDKRSFYVTHDVTNNLIQGKNAIGVLLGNGRFFAPRYNIPILTTNYGFPKALLQLNIEYEDGTKTSIVSDEKWKLTIDGPIQANNEYDGEFYDARKEIKNWNMPDFNASSWMNAEVVESPGERLEAQMINPIKVIETLHAKTVKESGPNAYIFDLGQNMSGWVRLTVKGNRGANIQLRFAESLKEDGSLFRSNLRSARQTDNYILKGEGTEIYEPRFTIHGFRYVEVYGYPGKPDLSAIQGRVVHDDIEQYGKFNCSNELYNQINKNIIWGLKSNYRSIPVDCPQRDERQGWLGDRAFEARGETYSFDVAAFFSKWMDDFQNEQKPNGVIPDDAPAYFPTIVSNSSTWAGNYVIHHGHLYDQYGDHENIRRNYNSLKSWLEMMIRDQLKKEDLLTYGAYGDWGTPPENKKVIITGDPTRITPENILSNSYFYYELKQIARFAKILDKPEDEQKYNLLADKIKEAINTKLFNKEKKYYGNNSPTSNILPLAFGIVPGEYKKDVVENLAKRISVDYDEHVASGLVGGQWMMRVLSDNGYEDLAWKISNQRTYPSLGYMIDNNATTVWELYNGNTADTAMNSQNHIMLVGDMQIWFYEYLAGIKADQNTPGFKHISMKPQMYGDLKFVNASTKSLYGDVKSAWKIEGGHIFNWNISIPVNSTATIYIPADKEQDVTENGKTISGNRDIKFLRMEDGRCVCELGSGNYSFSSKFTKPTHQVRLSAPKIMPGDTAVASKTFITMRNDHNPGSQIRYTLDNSVPTANSLLYTGPFQIEKRSIIQAVSFQEGYAPSYARSRTIDLYNPGQNGLNYKYYEGEWTMLPDFDKLKPSKTGMTYDLDVQKIKLKADHFGIMFNGFLNIEKEGEYTFYLGSDDGARLFIDKSEIINNDGVHGEQVIREKKLMLKKGKHSFKLNFFEGDYGENINLQMEGPDLIKQKIPGSMFFIK